MATDEDVAPPEAGIDQCENCGAMLKDGAVCDCERWGEAARKAGWMPPEQVARLENALRITGQCLRDRGCPFLDGACDANEA
jgi:hypothetical protein